jgi:hypothetical protein
MVVVSHVVIMAFTLSSKRLCGYVERQALGSSIAFVHGNGAVFSSQATLIIGFDRIL